MTIHGLTPWYVVNVLERRANFHLIEAKIQRSWTTFKLLIYTMVSTRWFSVVKRIIIWLFMGNHGWSLTTIKLLNDGNHSF